MAESGSSTGGDLVLRSAGGGGGGAGLAEKWPSGPAIVGRRSFIAKALFEELTRQGLKPWYLEKDQVGKGDLNYWGTIYLIAGVARPDKGQMDAEEDLVTRAKRHGRARVVYLSSMAVDRWERDSRVLSREGELYVLGKHRCERMAMRGNGLVLRAPVIFGEDQRLDSDQLLPTIARAVIDGRPIPLRDPMRPFPLVHVSEVARALADLGDGRDHEPMTILQVENPITPLELCAVAAPGHPVLVSRGWAPYVKGYEQYDNRAIGRWKVKLDPEDVRRTMAWYCADGSDPVLPPATLLLEG